jgi:hypothetical protein
VYIYFGNYYQIELLISDADCSDFFFPNGGFTERRFKVISYLSGMERDLAATPYQGVSYQLPSSETEGLGNLEIQGDCFGNIPPVPRSYVTRDDLESELLDQLLDDKHPIVGKRGSRWKYFSE